MSKLPLIPTFDGIIAGQEQLLVNARELHAFLESRQDFSTWIAKRIEKYDFTENQDFIRFHKKMEANNATLIDYHLTLDMAKELSMVERSDKGKMARQYFIACEKALFGDIGQLHALTTQNQALKAELLKARPFWSDVIRYKQLGLATHEIAKLTQRGKSTINSHVRMMQQLGFDVANDPQPLQLQMTLGV